MVLTFVLSLLSASPDWDCIGAPPNVFAGGESYESEAASISATADGTSNARALELARAALLKRVCQGLPCDSVERAVTRFMAREANGRSCVMAIVPTSVVQTWSSQAKPAEQALRLAFDRLLADIEKSRRLPLEVVVEPIVDPSFPNAERSVRAASFALAALTGHEGVRVVETSQRTTQTVSITGRVFDPGADSSWIDLSWTATGDDRAVLASTVTQLARKLITPPVPPTVIRGTTIVGSAFLLSAAVATTVGVLLLGSAPELERKAYEVQDPLRAQRLTAFRSQQLAGGLTLGGAALLAATGVIVFLVNRAPEAVSFFNSQPGWLSTLESLW